MDFGTIVNYTDRLVTARSFLYDPFRDLMTQYLLSGDTVVDVGAGAGAVASLAEQAKLRITIYGYEPSALHDQGAELATHLHHVTYHPQHTSLRNAGLPSFRAITASLSLHEIAASEGREQLFFDLGTLVSLMPSSGVFLVSDGVYVSDATAAEIQAANDYLTETIGHGHVPEDFISLSELQQQLPQCILQESSLVENPLMAEQLKAQGLRCPVSYYFAVFQKK